MCSGLYARHLENGEAVCKSQKEPHVVDGGAGQQKATNHRQSNLLLSELQDGGRVPVFKKSHSLASLNLCELHRVQKLSVCAQQRRQAVLGVISCGHALAFARELGSHAGRQTEDCQGMTPNRPSQSPHAGHLGSLHIFVLIYFRYFRL